MMQAKKKKTTATSIVTTWRRDRKTAALSDKTWKNKMLGIQISDTQILDFAESTIQMPLLTRSYNQVKSLFQHKQN